MLDIYSYLRYMPHRRFPLGVRFMTVNLGGR